MIKVCFKSDNGLVDWRTLPCPESFIEDAKEREIYDVETDLFFVLTGNYSLARLNEIARWESKASADEVRCVSYLLEVADAGLITFDEARYIYRKNNIEYIEFARSSWELGRYVIEQEGDLPRKYQDFFDYGKYADEALLNTGIATRYQDGIVMDWR